MSDDEPEMLRARLARMIRERDTAILVAEEALAMLSPEQLAQLRRRIAELTGEEDEPGGAGEVPERT
jgi:ABC-type ATPase with predicted acetyltransferase domain